MCVGIQGHDVAEPLNGAAIDLLLLKCHAKDTRQDTLQSHTDKWPPRLAPLPLPLRSAPQTF